MMAECCAEGFGHSWKIFKMMMMIILNSTADPERGEAILMTFEENKAMS